MNTACLFFIAGALWHMAATRTDYMQCYVVSALLMAVGLFTLAYALTAMVAL